MSEHELTANEEPYEPFVPSGPEHTFTAPVTGTYELTWTLDGIVSAKLTDHDRKN